LNIKIEIFGSGYIAKGLLEFYSSKNPELEVYLSPREFIYAYSSQKALQLEQIRMFTHRHPDLLINAAGPTSILDSFKNEEDYLRIPIALTKFLVSASEAVNHKVTILQISTASVYGECKDRIANELTVLNPMSPYAGGKALADECLSKSQAKWTIMRATSIYSNALNARVLGRLRNGLKKSEPIVLGGSGQEMRDFMHIDDFARAILVLVNSRLSKNDIFLAGFGTSISLLEVAQIAINSCEKKNLDFSVQFDNSVRPGDPFAMAFDTSKINSLNFAPLVQPMEGLASYFGETS